MLMISLNHIITPQPPINLARTLSFSPTTLSSTSSPFPSLLPWTFFLCLCLSLPLSLFLLLLTVYFLLTLSLSLGLSASLTSFSSQLSLAHFASQSMYAEDSFPSFVFVSAFVYVCAHMCAVQTQKTAPSFSVPFQSSLGLLRDSRPCPPFVLGTFLIKLIWDWMNLVTCLSLFHFSFSLQYTFCVRGRKGAFSQMWMCCFAFFFFNLVELWTSSTTTLCPLKV